MRPKELLAGKNVVVMGLGVFGGGAASAKFCLKHGAHVTVTDLRNEDILAPSLRMFTKKERENITFVLGEHRERDFKEADIVIVNPGVPNTSPFLAIARKSGASFENDASLFFRFSTIPTIAVTGTRGKTTTTNWIAQLLSPFVGTTEAIGNSSNNPLLNELSKEKGKSVHVAELSSWQLELLPESGKAPHIAIITNIFPDHLNRYDGMEGYASAKANIFTHQTADDFLVLNYDNPWRDFFLQKGPRAQVVFFSMKKLPRKHDGMFLSGSDIIFQKNGVQKKILSIKGFSDERGVHNTANLIAASCAIHLFDPRIRISQKSARSLTEIPFRQQTVYSNAHLRIINDSTATSPDGLIAAIDRFASKNTVFIAGGTRKNVSFDDAARSIKKKIRPRDLILLKGSATNDLLASLAKIGYRTDELFASEELKECFEIALSREPKTLVFSPGSASFEKFKNEFDRGERFDDLVRTLTLSRDRRR